MHRYKLADVPYDKHAYTTWFQRCIANGLGAARTAASLARGGLRPDVIIGHAGWGELIFMQEIFPNVPLLGYFEYYFVAKGGMIVFDPEYRETADISARIRARNAPNYLSLEACDDGYSQANGRRKPTQQLIDAAEMKLAPDTTVVRSPANNPPSVPPALGNIVT